MANSLNSWVINAMLASLFIVCMITFGVTLGGNYGKASTIMPMDTSAIEHQVNQTSNTANTWKAVFLSDNLFIQLGGIIVLSIWGITTQIFTTIITLIVLFLTTVQGVLGIPPLMTSSIIGIAIISLIFLAWRTIKTGQ